MARALHRLSILLTLVVVAGFTLFAVDEMDGASTESRDRVTGAATASTAPADERQLAEERLAGDGDARTVAPERQRERRNSQVREWIDDAGDALLAPFDGLAENAGDIWVRRGVPALLGVLLYGFGLGFAARFMRARA